MLDIHILGTGAMACLWASYFPTRHNLHFIQRHSKAASFDFEKKPGNTFISGHSLTKDTIRAPIKHLIVATKAFDAKAALDSIRQHLAQDAQILLLQNGMGSQQLIGQAYEQYAVYACSSTEGAYKSDPHTLVHAGIGQNHIGAMTQLAKNEKIRQWLPAEHFIWQADMEPILWRKLIINSVINPLTVIYQCRNGELIQQEKIRQHMLLICKELDELLEKLPFKLDSAYSLATGVCQLTANNYSSMYQDWQKNRPTEIDFISGFIVQACQKYSIACPQNKKLLAQVRQLQSH
ncbi:MAG: 2-dehydropantoate 2-reductase [Bermanella sp.]